MAMVSLFNLQQGGKGDTVVLRLGAGWQQGWRIVGSWMSLVPAAKAQEPRLRIYCLSFLPRLLSSFRALV